MIFEWMSDPSAWVGLLTLIVLEIVLGIDNLVLLPFWRRNCRQNSGMPRGLWA